MPLQLVSPATFREMDARARQRIIGGLHGRGLDHAMYVLVDDAGDVARVVRCCTPARPCPANVFRIRADMAPPVLPLVPPTQPARREPGARVFSLPSEPESIPAARHLVDDTVATWGLEAASAVGLVLSELVTNAVVHAHLDHIVVSFGAPVLRIEVHDDDPHPPVMREPDPLGGGYGLHLVDELSQRWGWEAHGDGKVVWSELPARATAANGAGRS